MIKIVVMGHGGYAKGVQSNLEMVVGLPDNFHFVDLEKNEDLATFEKKVNNLVSEFKDDQILFVCDLLGASPFRVAALLTANNSDRYCTLSGINMMAFMELAMPSDESLEKIAARAVETTKESVSKFPE